MSGVPYHAWTHAPKAEGGTDPLNLGGTSWMCLSTGDIGFEEDGDGTRLVDWYEVYMSENAAEDFAFDVIEGGGQFTDDSVTGRILRSGVFSITLWMYSGDWDDTAGQQIGVYVRASQATSGYAGPAAGFSGLLYTTEHIGANSGDDPGIVRSWTLPVAYMTGANTTPGDPDDGKIGDVEINHFTHDLFWTIRLWIVRHGDVQWTPETGSNAFINPTWETGDPIP